MLRLMLDGHPRISCIHELDCLFDYLEKTPSGWRIDLDALAQDWIFRETGLRIPEGLTGVAALHDLIGQVQDRAQGGTAVFMLHRGLDKALEVLPEPRVIHLLRDPRDVARSWVGMGWQGNAYRAIEGWIETEGAWDETRLPAGTPVTDLHYEALIADPQGTLDRLCAFMGEIYDPAMLDYPDRSTYSEPDPRLSYQWRKKMSAQDVRLIEGRLGQMLRARDYRPSGKEPLIPSPVHRAQLILQSAYRRWRFAIGRYGALPVLRAIGKRLGMERLALSAQSRIDAITTEKYIR